MKLIVAGSRNVDDVEFIESVLDGIHINTPITCVISGLARGPDTIGKEWAEKRGIPVSGFAPDWDKYGKVAGFIRNSQMANEGDAAVIFYDGQSSGSKNMAKTMVKLKKSVRVILMPTLVPKQDHVPKYANHNELDF